MLHDLVRRSAERSPHALAVHASDLSLSYGELDRLADAWAEELRALGVVAGDRIATWHDKSAAVVGIMQAALRIGAAYVPLDPTAPLARVAHIVADCACAAIATTAERRDSLLAAGLSLPWIDLAPAAVLPKTQGHTARQAEPTRDAHALAYILYTSGSTGAPKGVCLSHDNALAFVRWAVERVGVKPEDRLSNHAPFHFDLSVFDLYAAFAVGASVHLVPETAAYAPRKLVDFVREHAVSVWYSVPSALTLMVNEGELLAPPPPSLRTVIFAGEVYPTRQLRRLQAGLPGVALHNFFGPTETNVCTAYVVGPLTEADVAPVPIGTAASGDALEIRGADGAPVAPGTQGELYVSGPTVMLGYWGKPPQEGPYATGDLVTVDRDGVLHYGGRRDHQVKVRGHRIELGEIEAVLGADERIEEVAVLVEGSGMGAKLVAYVVAKSAAPSLVALKRVCASRLPRSMIIDAVRALSAMPRTGNGKIDRAALARHAQVDEVRV